MALIDFLARPIPVGVPGGRAFIKMHGLRNHFAIVDLRRGQAALSKSEIIRICDVHVGLGAEQVIAIEPATRAGVENGAYAFMRILNIDGTEAEACGNATRCLAHLLFEESGHSGLMLETLGGFLQCKKSGQSSVSVTLGPLRMDWQSIPLSRQADTMHLPIESGPLVDGVAVNVGNPHVVYFVANFDAINIPQYAPVAAASTLLRESANIGVAEVIDGATIKLQVWERPGMLTQACGTGACAAAFAGRRRGLLLQDDITVHLPAGKLDIRLLPDDRAVMTGPVDVCCVGYI